MFFQPQKHLVQAPDVTCGIHAYYHVWENGNAKCTFFFSFFLPRERFESNKEQQQERKGNNAKA